MGTPHKREERDAADMPWNKSKPKRKTRPPKVARKKAKRTAPRRRGKR